MFSAESISKVESIVAKNGIESMNCKLFEADHEDISCEIFDIVASMEICDANTVSFRILWTVWFSIVLVWSAALARSVIVRRPLTTC